MRIAALEDDDAQREAIARLLVSGGHNCQCFQLATPLIAALRRETFDLLVLDWNLPDDEATTIAGLVIHESKLIPRERQAFTFYGKRFIIMKREKNRITRLRIRPAEVNLPAE